MKKLLFIALILLANSSFADTASTYQKTCATCHEGGVLNAPKKGDKTTWQHLMSQKGMDGLVKSTKQGMPQMPAKGLCATCSDDDFRQLIEYMKQ